MTQWIGLPIRLVLAVPMALYCFMAMCVCPKSDIGWSKLLKFIKSGADE